MIGVDTMQILFIASAFLFQMILIAHFITRRWRFGLAMQYGWIVYALSIPAIAVSIILLQGGIAWSQWLGGFIYLVWSIFGLTVEYVMMMKWRNPIHWGIFIPYVILYLATIMFYWFPLGLIAKPLWYVYAVLFIISTILNFLSHSPVSTRST